MLLSIPQVSPPGVWGILVYIVESKAGIFFDWGYIEPLSRRRLL